MIDENSIFLLPSSSCLAYRSGDKSKHYRQFSEQKGEMSGARYYFFWQILYPKNIPIDEI
jgi:hypothetical protein